MKALVVFADIDIVIAALLTKNQNSASSWLINNTFKNIELATSNKILEELRAVSKRFEITQHALKKQWKNSSCTLKKHFPTLARMFWIKMTLMLFWELTRQTPKYFALTTRSILRPKKYLQSLRLRFTHQLKYSRW